MSHNALTQLQEQPAGETTTSTVDPRSFEKVAVMRSRADARGLNLANITFRVYTVTESDFSNADLTNASFPEYGSVRRSSFDGATMVGMQLGAVIMKKNSFKGARLDRTAAQNANFKGSDFSGASLDGTVLWGANLKKCTWKDTDMRGAILNNAYEAKPDSNLFRTALYERFAFDEAARRLGVDDDTLKVLIWAQDVEVRDNQTCELVHEDFDPTRHHIPIWSLEGAEPGQ